MRFNIKAMRAGEGLTALSFDASNPLDATRQAEQQGYTVLAVAAHTTLTLFARNHARFPLVLFSQELLALLDAGLPLVEAVETLAEKEHRPEVKRAIGQVIALLYEGRTLSQALEQFPLSFPALYIASVRAAERTGNLSEALARYIAYQTQLDIVKKKLVSAMIYPVMLVSVGGLVTLFLMGYVVPKFSRIFDDVGGHVPLMSRLLIHWGVFMEGHAVQIGMGVLGMVALAIYLARLPAIRRWAGLKLWRIPALGERMRVYQLARFYRTVGMLLNGGIPVVTALEMVQGLLHPTLRGLLQRATTDIREGKPTSQAMEAHQLTTPVSLRMLRVGERTGRMGEMMERIAGFYDEEMARWVDWFTRLFEPILMAVIGVLIGGIVVLMYMPIFDLAGSIQ
ncbi:MAG: type II secretion system F family protein [Sulfuriferula sp.]